MAGFDSSKMCNHMTRRDKIRSCVRDIAVDRVMKIFRVVVRSFIAKELCF
jgi:hypothetical protein